MAQLFSPDVPKPKNETVNQHRPRVVMIEGQRAWTVEIDHRQADDTNQVGQMNAHDRKTIHLALKRDGGVRTKSLGEGYYKKLVIFPKKRNNKKPRAPRNEAQVEAQAQA